MSEHRDEDLDTAVRDWMSAVWRDAQAWPPAAVAAMALSMVHLAMINARAPIVDLAMHDPAAGYPVYVLAARGQAVADVRAVAAGVFAAQPGRGARVVKQGEAASVLSAPAACRACGCTDARACPGGCCWVYPGLCSRCVLGAVKRAAAAVGDDARWYLYGELLTLAGEVRLMMGAHQ